jgi:hypothetical protein
VLRRWPAGGGLLLEHAGGQPNYAFHGLALIALLHRRIEHTVGNAALLAGIERARGIALEDRGINRQNNSIQAWSWIADTFSWVEPTAYCLLALKRARGRMPVVASRIADAESLLYDRCCLTGGWNYGNSNMLGQELPAYVPTTALALLALQDRTSEGAFVLSQAYLEKDALSEPSAIALSLALIALRVFRRPVAHIEEALEKQIARTMTLGNQHALAMALYALRTDHRDAPFTL